MPSTAEKLRSFLKLEPNWDSYDGLRIKSAAVYAADSLTSRVEEEPIAISPLPDGGVFLEWDNIEVEVSARGNFSYFLVDSGEEGIYVRNTHSGLHDLVEVIANA
jgi:hypothetical protein